MKPIAFTNTQVKLIQNAAKRLPRSERADFLEAVANHLGAQPSDAAVELAIDAELALGRLPAFVGGAK